MRCVPLLALLLVAFSPAAAPAADPALPYRVGIAKADITPEHQIRLNGFGGRRTESEGVYQKLWARAIAIEDGSKSPVVLMTTDVLGIPADIYDELAKRLEKKAGIPANKIVLAGFSQGGAIVLQTGLRHAERLGGILALSTYLPLKDTVEKERQAANKDLPIFLAHGSYDDMIRMERATATRDALTALGNPVEWHEYPMPHSVCPEEIGHIADFLRRVL